MLGIDVSEHNGTIDWQEVRGSGISFAIIRLGWGAGHLDGTFYRNINGAMDAGLACGVYYYSYAVTEDAAREEAAFTCGILSGCGLPAARLPMGCWLDMEDADGWKDRHGVTTRAAITALSRAYLTEMERQGYPCGMYASYDWLEHRIDTARLGVPLWCAQWGPRCGCPGATLWQFTDALPIGDAVFDGDRTIR